MKHLFVFTIFTLIFVVSIFGFFNLMNNQDFILAQENEVLGEKIYEDVYVEEPVVREPKYIEIVHPVKVGAEGECELKASSAIVIDKASGLVMQEKNADEQRAIASITKLMTALVFLDYNPGWDEVYKMKAEDRANGGTVYLYLGEEVRIKDLFHASLVGSDNTATRALVHSVGLSEEDFVKKMNEKAGELGLSNTFFHDSTGLSDNNISTARETAIFVMKALSREEIRQATLKPKHDFATLGGRKKSIPSTDYLLKNLPPNGMVILGGKTGYTDSAGFCFTGEFSNEDGRELISVVLNSPTYSSRFYETKDLVEWVYANYEWQSELIEVFDF